MTRGAVLVAYGEPALRELAQALEALGQSNPDLPVAVISDQKITPWPVRTIYHGDADPGARLAKLAVHDLSPWDQTVYLDADTRPRVSLAPGFTALEAGWDMVIVPSRAQEGDFLWLCSEQERQETIEAYGTTPVALGGGVMWFRRSLHTALFFEQWSRGWSEHEGQDQGALLRALARCPLRVWLFGHPWNGGALVAHHYGQARRPR